MLVADAINEIRMKINDRDMVGLDDSELLSYLNEAIQYISAALITYKSPFCIKDIEVMEDSFMLPNNFAQWCGTFPFKITGNTVDVLCELPVKARYFESYENVVEGGELPFNNVALDKLAIKIACIYAQNQEHEEISQDKELADELKQMVAAALGVGA